MRVILAVLFFLLPMGALADDGQCPVVRKRSFDRITCTLLEKSYELEYRSKGTYNAVRWSGQHKDLIRTLCEDVESVTEFIGGKILRTVQCRREVAEQ